MVELFEPVKMLLLAGFRPMEIRLKIPTVSSAFISGVRQRIGLPCFNRGLPTHPEKDQIVKLLRDGLNPREIKKQIPNVSGGVIHLYRKRIGLAKFKAGRPRGLTGENEFRLAEVLRLHGEGKFFSEIANGMNLSRQRVDQLLHRQEHYARTALGNAVRTGKIIKPLKCKKCRKNKPLQGHHSDYSKALNVQWLCSSCHGLKHRRKII